MKKYKLLVLGAVIVIVALSVFYFFYQYRKNEYLNTAKEFDKLKPSIWMEYYCSWWEGGLKSMDQIIEYWQLNSPEDLPKLKKYTLSDKFSHRNNNYLLYPLYNHDGNIESFILISAGIDGKQNTKLSEKDTLYVANWQQKISVYNYEEIIEELYLDYPRKYEFNIWNYWFGKKDYVVLLGSQCPSPIEYYQHKIDSMRETRRK